MTQLFDPELAEKITRTAQERFNELYITSTEICATLGVARSGVLYARKSGLLPEPICVNDSQLFIWERAHVAPYLEAWKITLNVRRNKANAAN